MRIAFIICPYHWNFCEIAHNNYMTVIFTPTNNNKNNNNKMFIWKMQWLAEKGGLYFRLNIFMIGQ